MSELLEQELATHSSVLAWRSPWTEEPGGLESMGSQRVGHDCVTSTHACPGSMSWQMVVHGVAESDTTQQLNERNELHEHWGTCVFLNYGLHRLLSLVLCDDLEGWDGGVGGRLKWEGIYVYI